MSSQPAAQSEASLRSRSAPQTRVLPFAVFWFALWPAFAILSGAASFVEQPLTKDISFWLAFGGEVAGAIYTLPQFLVCAALLYMVSLVVFRACAGRGIRGHRWLIGLAEPALALFAASFGIALEFPALLNHPSLRLLRPLRVYEVYVVAGSLLLLIVLGLAYVRRENKFVLRYAGALIVFVGFGWSLTTVPIPGSKAEAKENATVLLGLDSMSQSMPLASFRDLSQKHGGAYYEHAVTPGLLTNAVWASLIMHRPVRDTGAALTFQSPDWNRSSFNLVKEAKRRGFETWGYFDDQTTSYAGTLGGFDHNCSGPMGWLQFATSTFKNGSILVPFIVSRLPEIPFAYTPRNQSATYAFDVRAEVRSILTRGDGRRPSLVLAHIDYLHFAAYPRFSDLTSRQKALLLRAPAEAVQDFSADWQYPSPEGEPLGLYLWKVDHLQRVVAEEAEATRFLDPNSHNRLAIFSDHGRRFRLTNDNFGQRGFYEVPLVTFGVPPRDTKAPTSILDVPSMFGFDDPSREQPATPMVEYINLITTSDWRYALKRAKWTADGRIEISPDVAEKFTAAMKTYRPYANPPGYSDR